MDLSSPIVCAAPQELISDFVHESRSHEPLVCLTDEKSRTVVSEVVVSESCGWNRFRPKCLQGFRTARWVLFWLCWAGFLQGLIVNGFINVVITTIERRYQLRSTESGLIAGGYDIASFLCLIPVSYFGGSRSKPVFIGTGVLVLAIGSLVFAMPHYLSGEYSFSQEQEDLCIDGMNTTNLFQMTPCDSESISHLSKFKYVFFLGQLLHGAGAAPFYTLGCTYLDENVPTKMSSLYLGIYYTMAVIGPAIGFLLGGQFLKLYVDIGVDSAKLGLTTASNVWVGAWWIGFIFTAVIGAFIAIPLTAFPKSLPGAEKLKAKKVSEMHQKLQNSEVVQTGFGTSLRDLPASLCFLITNPTFVFLSLAGATEGMLVSGLATFLPKVIESQFSLAASKAAFVVGLVTIPGAGGGTFLGGYLVKKLSLRCADIIKMCIIFTGICVAVVFIFVLHCPNSKFAGLNTFPKNRSDAISRSRFSADCNSPCKCSPELYNPVCGTDNVLYYSPCFAGCKVTYQVDGTKRYNECSCVQAEGITISTNTEGNVTIQASREKCSNHCTYMPAFLLFIFLSMLLTFLVSMPSLTATLRCVAESQKSFALGIQWIGVRLFGTIPAPMMFGKLIDWSCELWHDTCNEQGACLFYDNQQMSTNVLILASVLKALSTFFFLLAWLLYKAPSEDEVCSKVTQTATSLSIIQEEVMQMDREGKNYIHRMGNGSVL